MKSLRLTIIVTFLCASLNAFAQSREQQWLQVKSAVYQGLPKTAIEHLEPIIQGALRDQAYPEAIRAIAEKAALESQIQGNKPEERIKRLQSALALAPAPMRPMMEVILAQWYWQYFQQNRWRFVQRTPTAVQPGTDIATWDLARILADIDHHFSAALAHEGELKEIPIAAYSDLLEPGNVPDAYRPTLFDFVANQALAFYQAGEQGVTVGEHEFEIAANSPVFARAPEFESWHPSDADPEAAHFKAIRLFQDLLRFHAHDTDRSAFYDVDFARLKFAHNAAVGDDKDQRYRQALELFIADTQRHPICTRAMAELARQLVAAKQLAQAHVLASRGMKAFPDSAGATECFNLLQQIESRSFEVKTERVWNRPWPTLEIRYRNFTKLYFRAVPIYLWNELGAFGSVSRDRLRTIVASKPAADWTADLPPTPDFVEHTSNVPVPTTLKPGLYAVIASADPEFHVPDNNQVNVTSVWVSDLAMVVQQRNDGTGLRGMILHADSGEPVAGATVRGWNVRGGESLAPVFKTSTDANGRFEYVGDSNATLVVLAESGEQAISNETPVWTRKADPDDHAGSRTVFFTDRALYRPGQTIQYKGVRVRFDQDRQSYYAEANARVDVVFKDPNGQEIGRVTQRTNDYGSFSGTFTAPRDRLTGRMTLAAADETGAVAVSVEEYKRPKFRVEIQPPAKSPQLGAAVSVPVKATAYTGAAIGGATIVWRVVRGYRFPDWLWWWRPETPHQIAHGSAVTNADGTFQIDFIADPDRSVEKKNNPVFEYTVYADVTDTTGETRSDERSFRIGYTNLEANIAADDWQTSTAPTELTITTSSIDGAPHPAAGMVTIFALKQPATIERTPLEQTNRWYGGYAPENTSAAGMESWDLGEAMARVPFGTNASGKQTIPVRLTAGIYRAVLDTKDAFGQPVTARRTIVVTDPEATHCDWHIPDRLAAKSWSVEPGTKFTAVWDTGYNRGRAFVEIECNGKPLRSFWTPENQTQTLIEQDVTESMRGGFTIRVTYVRKNRAYLHQHVVEVPWTNKKLDVTWQHFRSKLEPGEKETWTAVIAGPDGERAAAEMVATLYDASLDQYLKHSWRPDFGVLRREYERTAFTFENSEVTLQPQFYWDPPKSRAVVWQYRHFPSLVMAGASMEPIVEFGQNAPTYVMDSSEDVVRLSPFSVSAPAARGYMASSTLAGTRVRTKQGLQADEPESEPDETAKLSQISARKNLNETAFFFPHLNTDEEGRVRMTFTMPEALTEWRLLAFAHDAQLRTGFLTATAVTAKDLMVEPNPPRFVREGDVIKFTVKVSNTTEAPKSGTVRLTFADAATGKTVDTALGNRLTDQRFTVSAKQSQSFAWRITIPDGAGFLTYRAVATAGNVSDGEEGYLPVLSRRVLVTESLPLSIRGQTTRSIEFKKLIESGASPTLRQEALTVQVTSRPAWYAVLALPYLMEFPYECNEQVFNRFYANALARHIVTSNPQIRRVFDLWRNTSALDSPLEKNAELKSITLEETPWVRAAENESAQRRNVGLLFDENRTSQEASAALAELATRQGEDGRWSWFPGGSPSTYITLYIAAGFGRLRHLGVDVDLQPALKSLGALDAAMVESYGRMRPEGRPTHVPSAIEALYLYARSFFLADRPIPPECKPTVDYLLAQARKYWLQTNCRQTQAQLALALERFGDHENAAAIMKSLKERSVSDADRGMFWRDTENSWWWYDAPIETQAVMIEAFDEVMHDQAAVEACQVWLLDQKRTQDWRTTKATADAVYALLLRGSDLLAGDALVRISLGGTLIHPETSEAGTGFYEQRFVRGEIKPSMGHITVTKTDGGLGWASVHWQYLEDIAKVTPHEGMPLSLKKRLYVKTTTANGQVLKPVNGPVAVGDELVVRLELRTDRDMEFVHLKDQRASGTEPVDVLSEYRYQDGLGYYESTRDTATHFFIDYLRKGTYVFEYSTRVQLKGRYQTGVAEIQCMYAPEFNAHSQSISLDVK